MTTQCGKPTKSGEPCKLTLHGGKCPTHDCDLSARNSRVAQAFKAEHPRRFTRQRRAAGHNGFVATGGKLGWAKANEAARLWRLEHPSGPEQWVIGILAAAGLVGFEREADVLGDGRPVDFAFREWQIVIECNGHQDKPSFGEPRARFEKHQKKMADLYTAGWRAFVVNARREHSTEAAQLVAWLHREIAGGEE